MILGVHHLLLCLAIFNSGVSSQNVEGQWTTWTECDEPCDGGLRTRHCVWNPMKPPDNPTCPKDGIETDSCNLISCDTQEPLKLEGMSQWSAWAADPETPGELKRTRTCENEDKGCDGYLDESLVVSDIISSSTERKKVPKKKGGKGGGKKKKEMLKGTIEKGQVKPDLSEWYEVSSDGKYIIEEYVGKGGVYVKGVASDWGPWSGWKRSPDGSLTSTRKCKKVPCPPGQDTRRKRKQPKVFRREGKYDVEVPSGNVVEFKEDWEEYGEWELQEDGTYIRKRNCKNTNGPCRGYDFQKARLAKIVVEAEAEGEETEYEYEDEKSFNASRKLKGKRGKKHIKTTVPTTQKPTTLPITQKPTTVPTTQKPTTLPTTIPTTQKPTTLPTTQKPTTVPTTQKPTTLPTTVPTTQKPTTLPTTIPTTQKPTTLPTTVPTTQKPTTLPTTIPTTQKPTTLPTTVPTTQKPTTLPTTVPTTQKPTTLPTTVPTTQQPTTLPATQQPTTLPATQQPTTVPATQQPTTLPVTQQPTTLPITQQPTTLPITQQPTTLPVTQQPTTLPVTQQPTTLPVTQQPTTLPVTQQPTTLPATLPTTQKPTTLPTTFPTTLPTTQKPTTLPTTQKQTTLDDMLPGELKRRTKGPITQSTVQPTTLLVTATSESFIELITDTTTQPTTHKQTTQPTTQKPTTQPTTQKLTTLPHTQKLTTWKLVTQSTKILTTKLKTTPKPTPVKKPVTVQQTVLQPIIIPVMCGGLNLPCSKQPKVTPCGLDPCGKKIRKLEPEALIVPGSLVIPLPKQEEECCDNEEDEISLFTGWLDSLKPPSRFRRKGFELPPGCTIVPTALLKVLFQCDCLRNQWSMYEEDMSRDFFHDFYGSRRPRFRRFGMGGRPRRRRPLFDEYNYSYDYEDDFDYGRKRRPRLQRQGKSVVIVT